MIYFRNKAVELGCNNIDELCDMEVWRFIIANQPTPQKPIDSSKESSDE